MKTETGSGQLPKPVFYFYIANESPADIVKNDAFDSEDSVTVVEPELILFSFLICKPLMLIFPFTSRLMLEESLYKNPTPKSKAAFVSDAEPTASISCPPILTLLEVISIMCTPKSAARYGLKLEDETKYFPPTIKGITFKEASISTVVLKPASFY
jgi:hypothetical protein